MAKIDRRSNAFKALLLQALDGDASAAGELREWADPSPAKGRRGRQADPGLAIADFFDFHAIWMERLGPRRCTVTQAIGRLKRRGALSGQRESVASVRRRFHQVKKLDPEGRFNLAMRAVNAVRKADPAGAEELIREMVGLARVLNRIGRFRQAEAKKLSKK